MPSSEPIVWLPGIETIDITGQKQVHHRQARRPTDVPELPVERPASLERHHHATGSAHEHRCPSALAGRARAEVELSLWSLLPAAHAGCAPVPTRDGEVQRGSGRAPRARPQPVSHSREPRHLMGDHRALGAAPVLAARLASGRAGRAEGTRHRRALLHAQAGLRDDVRQPRHPPHVRRPARPLELALHRFLDELPGKDHTEVVCMDLSETYRSIARRHFPNAVIVADRFHVIRVVGQCLMECWKQLEPVGRKNRGLVSLMRRKPENLDPSNACD
jgi:hypothetical protein